MRHNIFYLSVLLCLASCEFFFSVAQVATEAAVGNFQNGDAAAGWNLLAATAIFLGVIVLFVIIFRALLALEMSIAINLLKFVPVLLFLGHIGMSVSNLTLGTHLGIYAKPFFRGELFSYGWVTLVLVVLFLGPLLVGFWVERCKQSDISGTQAKWLWHKPQ